MTPQLQVQEFLNKPFRSHDSYFEFNFYFKDDYKGLMEIVYLLKEQTEFLKFEIDYIGEKPMMKFDDVQIILPTGDKIKGFDKPLSDALYFLTHEISYISN